MKKTQFSMEELQEMDSIQIRGGAGEGYEPPSQEKCKNTAKGCGGGGIIQKACENAIEGCSDKPIVTPILPQINCKVCVVIPTD